jgi:FKBP-type peptidyl-prolyl cis-trans isomerase (trigger factor)
MAVTVETLEKLERKITLTLPVTVIKSEVDSRLKRLARTVKMDGFRPGKVPMNVVTQRYGYSVHYEVMNDKVGEAFATAANEAKLRVAGQPRITESQSAPEGEMAFDAVFEVFPEVKMGDLATASVERVTADVNDAAIDKTVDILRKQRRTFSQRAQDAAAQDGDRVTVDFEGKMDATVDGLRADIKKNLEREVKFRLLARNKQAAMDALVATAELDLPKSSVQSELDRMIESARADLKQRGVKDADKAPIPDDVFRPQAERRVRLGLVVAELVRANDLQAKPEQIKSHIEELAASYEKPADVVRWYYSENQRMAEVEAIVIENNVTDFVLSKATIADKSVSFDELMAQN